MKTNNVRFSIIVPAYNSSTFIRKCIESVLNQTYVGFELIIVDDGSQDNTLEICRAYAEKDPRVKALHKENGGHTSARNEGLKSATGEYVLFLDSDDWFSKETLECCCNSIVMNKPDVLIFRMENSDGTTPYKVRISDGCYTIRDMVHNSENTFILAEDGSFLFPKSLSGKCFRIDAIYNNQLQLPQNIRLGEDGIAFVGSMLKAEVINVIANNEKACYYCYVRPNSVSRTADSAAFEKTTSLLLHYDKILSKERVDYSAQFNRNVVAQLYTAALLVLRSGGNRAQLNSGLNIALKNAVIQNGLHNAKFNRKGYKFTIKKNILQYRLWWLAKLLDKVGK